MPAIISQDEIARLVKFGVTVKVVDSDGMVLGPRVVDYLDLDDRGIVFWWIGEDERLHTVLGETLSYNPDDSTLILSARNGRQVVVETVFNGVDREALTYWLTLLKSGTVVRVYPEGGHRAEL